MIRAAIRFVLLLVVVPWGAACIPAAPPEAREVAFEDLRRVVATLDDVAAEYPRAVAGGRVVDETRARVIATMLHHAEVYAEKFEASEREAVSALARRAAARAAPEEIVGRARRLRRTLVADHDLVLAPASPPDRERAEWFWDHLCAACHGLAGMGDGPQGIRLDPPPKDFLEPEFMAGLSPSRAFSQISDGVAGTAMPQWGLFTTSERWGLAFLVFGFRHDPDAIARGRAIVARAGLPSSSSSTADRTDRQLLADLRRNGLDAEEAVEVLAYLRAEAPFAAPTGKLAGIRGDLAALASRHSVRSLESVRLFESARRRLADSQDAVHAADPRVAARLEDGLAGLERGLATGERTELIERHVTRLGPVLDRAELLLRAPSLSGTARLALEWALAPALALGLWLGRARPAAPGLARAAACLAIAAGTGALLGAGLAHGALALVSTAAALWALARAEAAEGPVILATLCAWVGLPLGRLGRALHDAFGAGGVVPELAALLGLGFAAAAVAWIGARGGRAANAAFALALALAAAGTAGRGAWLLAHGPTLSLPRVEALGLLPAVPSVAVAAAAAVAALLAARRAAAVPARRAEPRA